MAAREKKGLQPLRTLSAEIVAVLAEASCSHEVNNRIETMLAGTFVRRIQMLAWLDLSISRDPHARANPF
jgi:hypothetical protein